MKSLYPLKARGWLPLPHKLGPGPMLGAWQGGYVFEHRRAVQWRSVVLHLLLGE